MIKFNDRHKAYLRNHLRKNKKLSKCETEVAILVIQGMISKEVAKELYVSEKTVKFHIGNCFKKLNVERRAELVWTLPLVDFILTCGKPGIESDKNPNSQGPAPEYVEPNKEAPAEQEESIPSGVSTVSDMI